MPPVMSKKEVRARRQQCIEEKRKRDAEVCAFIASGSYLSLSLSVFAWLPVDSTIYRMLCLLFAFSISNKIITITASDRLRSLHLALTRPPSWPMRCRVGQLGEEALAKKSQAGRVAVREQVCWKSNPVYCSLSFCVSVCLSVCVCACMYE